MTGLTGINVPKEGVQQITEALQTAATNIIAAIGAGGFLTQAAGDIRYAPIANGVTSGNSHTHLVGDGAVIDKYIPLYGFAATFSPADLTIYSFGMSGLSSTFFGSINKIYIPEGVSGFIKSARVSMLSGVAGSNENISMYLKINNTTNILIQTIGSTDLAREFINNSLNEVINEHDFVEFRLTTPTWGTNPTGVTLIGVFTIKY
jgi:hypothetical protein